ncbi:TetR/AcrR family transcriptional regulator [Embleya sp. NPDC059237]|uniref:TetR/AcrR family transcriptional regulator n=1 Tax=Embleya sp. NPDC059237 TaxID=3346784 RepID=UPI0036A961B5
MTDTTSRATRRRRAPSLEPEERRAAIIAATLPLLLERGVSVTTQQIARAAGVAEGTIFSVFPDKHSLVHAAVLSGFEPTPIVAAIAAIDPNPDLRDRLSAVIRVIADQLVATEPLVAALRTQSVPAEVREPFLAEVARYRQRLVAAVAEVVEPDRDTLRRPPTMVAQLVVAMVFATTRGTFGLGDALDTDEIATLLLDGLLVREQAPEQAPGPAPAPTPTLDPTRQPPRSTKRARR